MMHRFTMMHLFVKVTRNREWSFVKTELLYDIGSFCYAIGALCPRKCVRRFKRHVFFKYIRKEMRCGTPERLRLVPATMFHCGTRVFHGILKEFPNTRLQIYHKSILQKIIQALNQQ